MSAPWFTFHFQDWAISFLSVLLEGVPFLLLGSILSGIVEAFLPTRVVNRILPGGKTWSVLLSGLLGLLLPICECGSVVVIRRFIRKGLPVSCAVTYMLAAPIVSPVVALSTYAAFRGQDPMLMVLMRLGFGYLIAVAAGLLLGRVPVEKLLQPEIIRSLPGRRRTGLQIGAEENGAWELAESATFWQRCLRAVQVACADFLDVSLYLVVGVAITSVFNTAIRRDLLLQLAGNDTSAILVLMALAIPLALCSSSDAFIAASFIEFPVSAKLAFLVFGPVFDAKLFFFYGMLFRRKYVVWLGIALFIAIALLGHLVPVLLPWLRILIQKA